MRCANHIHDSHGFSGFTEFDMEIAEEEILGGYFQLQMRATKRDGFAAFSVDWGDGESGTATAYEIWHNYRAAGRYRVRLGSEVKWWRLWSGITVSSEGRYYVSCPAIFPVRWSDTLESCEGTYCGWNSSLHGGGVQGRLPAWGRSIKSTYCCYQYCRDVEGPFPPWTDAVEDACGTYDNCPKMRGPIPRWGRNIKRANQCFRETKVYGRFPAWPPGCVEMAYAYAGAASLHGEVPPWPETASVMNDAFLGCTGATGAIPPWPPNPTWLDRCYKDCAGLSGAWTDDTEELMSKPEASVRVSGDYYRCNDVVTGAGEGLRALFWDEPWGGSLPRPAKEETE